MNEDDVVKMLDNIMSSGVSRLKVDVSDALAEGDTVKKSHHGRCDVGSPFATGKLFDLSESDNDSGCG